MGAVWFNTASLTRHGQNGHQNAMIEHQTQYGALIAKPETLLWISHNLK